MIKSLYEGGITSAEEHARQLMRYGPCYMLIPVPSVPAILIGQVLTPFYMFQVFSVALWMWDNYRFYASCIALLSILSITTSLISIRRELKKLRTMAFYETEVQVLRGPDSSFVSCMSSSLVPGDVFEVPQGANMPCDAVLLSGSCIVNESMLTGESTPEIKQELPNYNPEDPHHLYSPGADKRHTLYGGT